MKRRDDDKGEEREVLGRSWNSKVRCKGGEKLVLLAAPKRGGSGETCNSTPVLPWKQQQQQEEVGGDAFKPQSFSSPIPARRLAGAVWQFVQYFSPSVPPETMDHYLHHRHQKTPPQQQPPTGSNLRRQVAMLLAQHHQSSEWNPPPPQQPSPASYASSLEISAYNQASTPTSSIELKGGKMGDSRFGFKTSTELLKVLNRIWTLEEQHVSNISLMKALKTELNHARMKVKELLRDQQSSRYEMNELMKQISVDKQVTNKIKEQDRVHATIKSLKDELEDERKLRKRSEGLHRRLAREIFEVKVAFSTSLKELDRERMSRCLVEDLCDEFAKGIIQYEQQAHNLRQKNEKSGTGGDRLVVHMSESWLDERIQIRDQQQDVVQGTHGFGKQEIVVDKIGDEIVNFLQTRKLAASKEDAKQSHLRRNSVESFSLNEVATAPKYTGNAHSAISTSLLFENEGFDSHINAKNELFETKPSLDQEKGTNKGKGAMDKSVSELLLSERNPAMVESSTSKNSLQAKLQEQKTRVSYRSRLKILKGSS